MNNLLVVVRRIEAVESLHIFGGHQCLHWNEGHWVVSTWAQHLISFWIGNWYNSGNFTQKFQWEVEERFTTYAEQFCTVTASIIHDLTYEILYHWDLFDRSPLEHINIWTGVLWSVVQLWDKAPTSDEQLISVTGYAEHNGRYFYCVEFVIRIEEFERFSEIFDSLNFDNK